jgi:hypothetical protein
MTNSFYQTRNFLHTLQVRVTFIYYLFCLTFKKNDRIYDTVLLCVISMFIYVCKCIGLHNIVIMMYMHFTMLYPINDLNLNLNLKINQIYNIKNVSAF